MTEKDPRPYLVVTVLLDPSARAAAITRSHGDAMERALTATAGADIAGLDIAELNISPKAFSHLRKNLSMPPGTIALYDLFPLASHLAPEHRKIAGQFLAAEALWALEEQGLTNGAPAVERFTLPDGWSKDPKEIRNKLVEVGALDLSATAIQTFAEAKKRWDETSSPTPDVTALATTADAPEATPPESDAGGDADDGGTSDTEPPPPGAPTEPPPPAPPTERPPPPVFDEETGEPKDTPEQADTPSESADA
jgi:hypothetical protein